MKLWADASHASRRKTHHGSFLGANRNAKILERMVLNRLHPVVDPSLDECQAGFRTGSDFPAYALLENFAPAQAHPDILRLFRYP